MRVGFHHICWQRESVFSNTNKMDRYHLSHQTEALALVGLMCYFLLHFSTDFVPKPLRQDSFHSYRPLRKEIDIFCIIPPWSSVVVSKSWCCIIVKFTFQIQLWNLNSISEFKLNSEFPENSGNYCKTRGFKSLRLNCWNITQVIYAKCQPVLIG